MLICRSLAQWAPGKCWDGVRYAERWGKTGKGKKGHMARVRPLVTMADIQGGLKATPGSVFKSGLVGCRWRASGANGSLEV